jgi:hypothetical protein
MERWDDGIWNGNRHFQACQKCDKRFPGCHGVCEAYAAEKVAYAEIKKSIKKEKEVDACIRSSTNRIKRHFGIDRKETFHENHD